MPEELQQTTIVRSSNGTKEVGIAGKGTENETKVISLPIWKLILIRIFRVYIQSFLGILTLNGLGVIEVAGFLENWGNILSAMILALAPSFVSLCQDSLEFLARIDVKSPTWRA